MPAKSEKQRKFMGAELARKRAGKNTKTGMSEKQQQCIKDALTEDKVKEVLSLTFQGKSDEISGGLRDDLVKCVSG